MTVYRRDKFQLSQELIYLNGNSLGPLTHAAQAAVAETTEREWGQHLIRAWNTCGWMEQPGRVGDKIARLIGAPSGSVMVGDTLTLKVSQALSAALALSKNGKRILSDTGNFPSDLYAARALAELVLVEPEQVLERLDKDIDVLLLTEVDYRTGRRHPMAELTKAAQDLGIICIWDLAHSVGAIEVNLTGCGAEFAVGCTYKYLNGGPGAPAFIYARPDLRDKLETPLVGWMGHAEPFAFDLNYRPAEGAERWRIGTSPVLQMAALEGALSLWEGLSLAEVEGAGQALSTRFMDQVAKACPDVTCLTPEQPGLRGGHVALQFDKAYPLMQVLIQQGIIGDFRAPDILRFGFSPLYNSEADVDRVVEALREALDAKTYEKAKYQVRARVT